MKFLLIRFFSLCLFVGLIFPANTEPSTGWSYIQTTQQMFYIFISPMNLVDASGNQFEGYGDGSNSVTMDTSDCGLNPGPCDVIGVFVSQDIDENTCNDADGYYVNGQCDICVGWSYYNSYSEQGNSIATTLAFMGADGDDDSQYYCDGGEVPKLKYYDASSGLTYKVSSESDLASFGNNEIVVYFPDCTNLEEGCNEYQAIIAEDDPLSNNQNEIPSNFEISSVFPNPFNPSVNIAFSLSALEQVNISVYDTIGREIITLFDGFKESGTHEVIWTPEVSISSGNYIIMMETPNNVYTSKVTFLK